MIKRLLLVLLTVCLFAWPARATWSIVVVNRVTGEVAVGTATCLGEDFSGTPFNIRRWVPVLVVGKGAVAAQSLLDQFFVNRPLLFDTLHEGLLTPQEMLDLVLADDSLRSFRQYGIVTFTGEPTTYTGTGAQPEDFGVTGQIGDYAYAIQGNLLTGDAVILAAEQAFRDTDGDMGQRIQAGMEAARQLGGDARCSCPSMMAGCGVPPPEFEKSAHAATLLVARMGDLDGDCNRARGCATGPYYLSINVLGRNDDPDPVLVLQDRYAAWRASLLGRPDGILSEVDAVDSLPADGRTKRRAVIQLRDVDGHPLRHGGAMVRVQAVGGRRALSRLNPVTDHGDGTYSFTLVAGTTPGLERYEITASDDLVTCTLFPYLEVETVEPQALHAGRHGLSASRGGAVPFVVAVPARPGAPYSLLGGPAGAWKTRGVTFGRLDGAGRAEPAFEAPRRALLGLVGTRLEWTAVVLGPGRPLVTNTVAVDIVP